MNARLQRPSDALALHHGTVRDVLPNGLTLLTRRDPSAPVVAIVTHVKAGYFDETDDLVGIAHVLEHMFFKGTPTRGVGAIARETKANGGYLNAHTIYDHTSYYTVLPSSSFVAGLEIQFDAYARSLIDGEELARELEVIIQEAKRKRDTASAVAIETLYEVLHDRHRIRRWRIGEEAGLRALTREQLVAFYRRWYRPDNTILAIVGDIDPDVVRREVVARYGALSAGAPPHDRGPRETMAPGLRRREWSGDIAQQHVAFGWRVPGLAHADAPALDLAGVALGSGRASRLYRAVRERQLASSVTAWDYTTDDIGVFVLHAEAPADRAREATQAMWREVQAARHDGLRASEVLRAQRVVEARWLRRLESMDGQAQYLASWEADGGLALASRYYDTLLSLDATQLQQALVAHLDPEQVSVVSYRPDGTSPLVTSDDELRALLAAERTRGSAVMPTASTPTPTDVAAVAFAAPEPSRRASRVESDVHVFTTSGGVPILILPRAGTPLVNVGVFQRGGAAIEAEVHEGLARLTAQAMLKGTRARSGTAVAEAAEAMGSSIGVSAGLESLGWSLSVPVRHLAAAAALLGEVVQHPAFAAEGVETERTLSLAEVARARDDMYRWPMRLAATAAFGGHPYARSVIGSASSLAELDSVLVAAYHAQHVRRGETVLAVVGDVDPEATAALLDRTCGDLVYHADVPLPPVAWPNERHVAHEVRAKQQTALALLFPGPARTSPARHAARVLAAIASGLGGRFFEQLRDRQSLAYTVAAFPIERRAGGAFAAYIATSPAREDEARDGLLREFARFVDERPTAEEVERACRFLVGTHAIAQQSGSAVLGDLVDAWLLGDGLHERHEVEAQLTAVTAADVQAVAQQYFDPSVVAEGVVRGTA
ncbi:MAG: M16 family metallopeptidase [Gemmatimonas sp.]|jgi:zinc protease|uniref:M16 family metallopeptidase n=1 Tax=Gemmatimonas sp. TaxID=1962908 RepID=UPI00391F89E7|nr:insulinase family protein [Gemmatimonadota bacterium]